MRASFGLPPAKRIASKRAGDGELVRQRERRERRGTIRSCEREREESRFHDAAAALRIEKNQAVEEFDFVGGADAAVEIFEIGAAAERDVLAIVHVLAIRQDIGGCAAAEKGSLFEQTYAPAASASATPAASPASPPPITITLFKDILFRVAARIARGR